ncbi:MAG: hypothetical protein KUG81_08775 [Gammaproteobacteria bacterium]|nr:hypothetical protein [Gammaproteobacteria bacterium]
MSTNIPIFWQCRPMLHALLSSTLFRFKAKNSRWVSVGDVGMLDPDDAPRRRALMSIYNPKALSFLPPVAVAKG